MKRSENAERLDMVTNKFLRTLHFLGLYPEYWQHTDWDDIEEYVDCVTGDHS